jgi:hypothetical protein
MFQYQIPTSYSFGSGTTHIYLRYRIFNMSWFYTQLTHKNAPQLAENALNVSFKVQACGSTYVVVSIHTGLYYICHIHNLMTGNLFLDSEMALDIASAPQFALQMG